MLVEQSAEQLLRVSMELGGNAPFLVFEDADLDAAVDGAMLAKMRNMGEACTAANRFLVHESRRRRSSPRKLAERMGALTVGRGHDDGVDVGPLIDAKAVDKVDRAGRRRRRRRAPRCVTGGAAADGPGLLLPADRAGRRADRRARCCSEEIFGPVAPITTFADRGRRRSAKANDTEYGLVAYVFTRDLTRAIRVAEALESGMVGINQGIVSNPAAPFGGVKAVRLRPRGRLRGHRGVPRDQVRRHRALTGRRATGSQRTRGTPPRLGGGTWRHECEHRQRTRRAGRTAPTGGRWSRPCSSTPTSPSSAGPGRAPEVLAHGFRSARRHPRRRTALGRAGAARRQRGLGQDHDGRADGAQRRRCRPARRGLLLRAPRPRACVQRLLVAGGGSAPPRPDSTRPRPPTCTPCDRSSRPRTPTGAASSRRCPASPTVSPVSTPCSSTPVVSSSTSPAGTTTPEEIARVVASITEEVGEPPIVLVDYLQKMPLRGHGGDEASRVTIVTETMKDMSLELGCPIVCISAADRESLGAGHRMRTRDLRGSSAWPTRPTWC